MVAVSTGFVLHIVQSGGIHKECKMDQRYIFYAFGGVGNIMELFGVLESIKHYTI